MVLVDHEVDFFLRHLRVRAAHGVAVLRVVVLVQLLLEHEVRVYIQARLGAGLTADAHDGWVAGFVEDEGVFVAFVFGQMRSYRGYGGVRTTVFTH